MALEFPTFTPVRLLSMNSRTENHGDGLSGALDLKCSVEVPNSKLNEIEPGLLQILYKAAESEEEKAAQAELPNVPEKTNTGMPLLRSHALASSLGVGVEYVGYQMTVDCGLGDEKSNLVLAEVKLNKITLSLQEGGTVKLGFRVQASMVSGRVAGQLFEYLKRDMFIALSPPKVRQMPLDGTTPESGDKVLDAGAKCAEKPKASSKPAAKRGKSAPDSAEIARAFSEAEKKGLNKPAHAVPAPPRKRSAKPSLKTTTTH